MPIRKYHGVEEMPPAQPLPPLAPGNLRLAFELVELMFRLRPWHAPPGVHKGADRRRAG